MDGDRAALPLWITEEATKFFQLFEPQGAKIIDKSLKSAILFRYAAKRHAPLAQLDRALVYGTKG